MKNIYIGSAPRGGGREGEGDTLNSLNYNIWQIRAINGVFFAIIVAIFIESIFRERGWIKKKGHYMRAQNGYLDF